MTIPAPSGNAIGGISDALLVQTQLPFFINPLDLFANLAIVLPPCRNRPLRGGGTPAEGQGASPGSFSWREEDETDEHSCLLNGGAGLPSRMGGQYGSRSKRSGAAGGHAAANADFSTTPRWQSDQRQG